MQLPTKTRVNLIIKTLLHCFIVSYINTEGADLLGVQLRFHVAFISKHLLQCCNKKNLK